MQRSQRSSAASSVYDYHAYFPNPPAAPSATSSVYDARSSVLSHPPLSVSGPGSSLFSRSAQSKDQENAVSSSPPRPSSAIPLNSPKKISDTTRRASVDSPGSAHSNNDIASLSQSLYFDILQPRNLDENPHGQTPRHIATQRSSIYSLPSTSGLGQTDHPPLPSSSFQIQGFRSGLHSTNSSVSGYGRPESILAHDRSRDSTMSTMKGAVKEPDLTLQVDAFTSATDTSSLDPAKRPKSPGVTGLFGWKRNNSFHNESQTTISDSRSMSSGPSPGPSPLINVADPNNATVAQSSPVLGEDDDHFAHGSRHGALSPPQASLPPAEDLLRELREVSTELAASIRREMELEDEVDRYRSEMPSVQADHNRRGSDYYSDSGASSARLIPIDGEIKMEGLEKMRRKAEQEKAQLKLEMAEKARQDSNQIKALELHAKSLEEQLLSHGSPGSQRELDDVKRKLTEERQFKDNFDELLGGMRQEIEAHRNERDNLRDEVVPQLKSRIEGLETQAADMQNLSYENSRLQQELQNTKNENETLLNARRLQQEGGRFTTISEEGDEIGLMSPGLARSSSLKRSMSSRARSNSLTKPRDGQTLQDFHAESFKALEDQRDALQRTLKSLILRQETMTRNHAKQISSLEAERDKALRGTPRRTALQFEVHHLRHEISHLRRRADEALEQKWQSEKGLSSLKMDLDRAHEETSSLRALLQDRDITNATTQGSDQVVEGNDSLDEAYADLQLTHAESIAKLQTKAFDDGDQDAHQLIEGSRNRMRDLSNDIESQLTLNQELRKRLGEAVDRGVREQEFSAKRIADLETSLRQAEEKVVAATNISEDAVTKEEEYVKTICDALDEQTRRGISRSKNKRISVISTGASLPSPFLNVKTPRLDATSSGNPISAADATRTESLERRVRELEEAAIGADREMQTLIEKMSRAQMEVAEFQTERDESIKQTRRLQREIVEERERMRAITA